MAQINNSTVEYVKLKIKLLPSFINECKIEFSGDQLIVVRSSLPEQNDPGEIFHKKLNQDNPVNQFRDLILKFIENPTEKEMITIADGIHIKIEIITDIETIKYTLSSIQDNSKEMEFVYELIDYVSERIGDIAFSEYLNEVKEHLK